MVSRQSCVIQLTDRVVVTGGISGHNEDEDVIGNGCNYLNLKIKNEFNIVFVATVRTYNQDGFLNDLPDLGNIRANHGCGYYVNNDNKLVLIKYL